MSSEATLEKLTRKTKPSMMRKEVAISRLGTGFGYMYQQLRLATQESWHLFGGDPTQLLTRLVL